MHDGRLRPNQNRSPRRLWPSGSLILLLCGVATFSPIEIRWPLFFASFFGSYMLMKGLFALAKLDKVRVKKQLLP
jgi:hypothetical protein